MNEIEELENILDAILKGVQEVLQSGEIIPEEFQMQIANEITQLTTEIDQLYSKSQQQVQPASVGEEPSSDAQLLWMLAGQQERAFIDYLRTFPTPATQNLLSNPQLLSETIDHLTRTMPPGQQPIVDGIQHADLNSSNIWGMAYNPSTGQMKVRFQGGAEYEYDGIPKNIFRAFSNGQASAKTSGKNKYGQWWQGKNPSLGAALNQYVKAGNYPYRRVK